VAGSADDIRAFLGSFLPEAQLNGGQNGAGAAGRLDALLARPPPCMRHEFTAIVEQDDEWIVAYCPEIPGANGQGRTKLEALDRLIAAIELILEDRRGMTRA